MRTVTKKVEIISERNQIETPEGTGMSQDALDFLLAGLHKCFGLALKEVMEKDNIVPANIEIQMSIVVSGHPWKAEE